MSKDDVNESTGGIHLPQGLVLSVVAAMSSDLSSGLGKFTSSVENTITQKSSLSFSGTQSVSTNSEEFSQKLIQAAVHKAAADKSTTEKSYSGDSGHKSEEKFHNNDSHNDNDSHSSSYGVNDHQVIYGMNSQHNDVIFGTGAYSTISAHLRESGDAGHIISGRSGGDHLRLDSHLLFGSHTASSEETHGNWLDLSSGGKAFVTIIMSNDHGVGHAANGDHHSNSSTIASAKDSIPSGHTRVHFEGVDKMMH